MKFQTMRREHLAACAPLYVAVFNGAPWRGKWTNRTALIHFEESFRDRNFRGMVALEDGSPIGFAYGVIMQWENERRFYLKELCVLGGRQRRGVGTRLLTHLMKKLIAGGVSQITLGTERDKPAKRFYLKLGFAIEPKIAIMNKRLRARN